MEKNVKINWSAFLIEGIHWLYGKEFEFVCKRSLGSFELVLGKVMSTDLGFRAIFKDFEHIIL